MMPDKDLAPDPLVEKRRRALKRALEEHNLRPVEVARLAGMPSPNSLYNYLNRHSKTLSAETYARIAAVIPGMTVDRLTGNTPKKVSSPVLVKTQCQGGVLREQFSLPQHQIRELPLPVDDAARMAGAFAAAVKHPGAEHIYRSGSLLLCVPPLRYEGSMGPGRRLIIERFEDMKIEVTVREVQADDSGGLWLSQRSTDPRLANAVRLPRDPSGKPWRHDGQKFAIAGVVIGAFIPET